MIDEVVGFCYKPFSRTFTISMMVEGLKIHLEMLKYIYYRILIAQVIECLRCIIV